MHDISKQICILLSKGATIVDWYILGGELFD